MKPWREVVFIWPEKEGPKGGHTRLLTLSCNHLFVWRNSTPKSLFKKLRSVRLAPEKVRCHTCPESP